jgi:hypothetical protein
MLYSQDMALNKLINKSVYGKSALLYFTNQVLIPDSTPVKKIEY